jgi:hypothetical protein
MGQDEIMEIVKDEAKPKGTKAKKPKPGLLKRTFRKTNLNHAKMSPEDTENLRIRVSMETHTRDKAQREQMVAIAVQESTEAFKGLMLNKYNLRPGKKYNFDLRTGEITNVKSPPKPIPESKPEKGPDEAPAPVADEKDAPAASAEQVNNQPTPPETEPSGVEGSPSNGEAA